MRSRLQPGRETLKLRLMRFRLDEVEIEIETDELMRLVLQPVRGEIQVEGDEIQIEENEVCSSTPTASLGSAGFQR